MPFIIFECTSMYSEVASLIIAIPPYLAAVWKTVVSGMTSGRSFYFALL